MCCLDDAKTPDSKGGRTISYNNEFDQYNKSRNDDAITCKRDCSKYSNLSDNNTSKTVDPQFKKRVNYLQSSNDSMIHTKQIGSLETKNNGLIPSAIDSFENNFERVAEPLEEIARINPNMIPLLKIARKGFEEACHRIITEEHTCANENMHKLKQELSLAKRERNLIQKEKETAERDADRYKNDIRDLQNVIKKLKLENKTLNNQAKKYTDIDRRFKKLEVENKQMKLLLDDIRNKDFDILRKLDLDEYNLTSDDLRSEGNRKYKKGVETKGHPLVPKLDFKKIYEWRDQQQLDDAQEDDQEEEEEEEELLTENEKFLFKGSELQSNASINRKEELEKRKEDVIAILNKTYAEDDHDNEKDITDELDSFKDNEVLFHDVAPEYEKSVNQLK